ncbi:MAG: hypothetical protein AAF547_16305 [Actinomycetota bacterium]
MRYLLILDADLNRVFTGALPEIAATELRLVAEARLPGALTDVERVIDGRTRSLRFDAEVDPADVAPLAGQLSASAALFVSAGEDLWRPVPIEEHLTYGTELATTQRYRGKTNERLARAMLNVALATAGIDPAAPSGAVLDPMCGRGTTLNWALAYGLDAIGLDVDRGDLEHHATFVEQWAKRARLPHKLDRFRPGNAEGRVATLRVAADRARFKADRGQTVTTFTGDAGDPPTAMTKRTVDAVVVDLPYGVQHRGAGGGTSGPGDDGRDTVGLLARVLPVWRRLLRSGGSLCVAWNTRTGSRRDVDRALVEAGFAPITVRGGFSMRHTVDASIDRDVIVATR